MKPQMTALTSAAGQGHPTRLSCPCLAVLHPPSAPQAASNGGLLRHLLEQDAPAALGSDFS